MAILAFAREMPSGNPAQPRQRPQLMQLATDEKTHEIGQLWFTVSNWGFFGSSRGEDNPLQCIIYEQGEHAGECRPSAEYPGGSGIEYLFQGALWIGAVVAGDTLVSVGEDGWFANVNELFPGYNQETDTIMENSIFWDSTAISEQDFIGEMTDTIRNSDYVDPTHIPIGIKVGAIYELPLLVLIHKAYSYSSVHSAGVLISEFTLTAMWVMWTKDITLRTMLPDLWIYIMTRSETIRFL